MKNIHFDYDLLKNYTTKGSLWLKDHCIEEKSNSTEDNIHSLYFTFGEEDEDNDFHTDNSEISRYDAINFVKCYLDSKWGINSDYHIDSLLFMTDGDEDDCIYRIMTDIFKK